MQWVGRAISSVSQYYKEINPATLTGAIDVIVVSNPKIPAEGANPNDTEELACSPFHVRFGKLSVLRPVDRKVRVTVNDEPSEFYMKVFETGEAFFVFETEDDVPEDILTSPVLSASGDNPDSGAESADEDDDHKLRGRKREMEPLDLDARPINGLGLSVGLNDGKSSESTDTSVLSKAGDQMTNTTPLSLDDTQKGWTDYLNTPQEAIGPSNLLKTGSTAKLSNEGANVTAKLNQDLTDAAPVEGGTSSDPNTAFPHSSYDDEPEEEELELKFRRAPTIRPGRPASAPPLHSRDNTDHTVTQEQFDHPSLNKRGLIENDSSATITFSNFPRTDSSLMLDTEGYKTFEKDNTTINPKNSSGFETSMNVTNTELGGDSKLLQFTRALLNFSMKTDDLITSPKRPSLDHPDSKSVLPARTMSESGVGDPYKFCLTDRDATPYTFELGIMGDKGDKEEFSRVSFFDFLDKPELLEDRRLVLQYDGRFLTWENASTVMASLAIYRASLLELTRPTKESKDVQPIQEPKPSAWSRWWSKGKTTESTPVSPTPRSEASPPESPKSLPADSPADNDETPATPPARATSEPPQEPRSTSPSPPPREKHYVKTLRLTSEQLKQLKLKPGANKITFSVRSSYSQGNALCSARIFLWPHDANVVISDIDGTITKSDALGHVLTMIGRDWTHAGVAKLYTDIVNNGYYIMYLTSRAIGQADTTREYLRGINQANIQLPAGPVIMSPDRLVASLHREVILRKPEVFKKACLQDIRRLFKDRKPFYAGFGNRITDIISYRSVDVQPSKIFTIDSGGEVRMELLALAGYKSTYIHMTDLVDQMFPPVVKKEYDFEYSDLNFWRQPPPAIDLPSDLDLTSPPSPALSARSDTRLSYIRLPGLTRSASKAGSTTTPSSITMERKVSRTTPSSPHLSGIIGEQWDIPEEHLPKPERSHSPQLSRTGTDSMPGSLPGSFDDDDAYIQSLSDGRQHLEFEGDEDDEEGEEEEEDDVPPDEDIDAGDMDFSSVPYL